jgi:hypothetical protein
VGAEIVSIELSAGDADFENVINIFEVEMKKFKFDVT